MELFLPLLAVAAYTLVGWGGGLFLCASRLIWYRKGRDARAWSRLWAVGWACAAVGWLMRALGGRYQGIDSSLDWYGLLLTFVSPALWMMALWRWRKAGRMPPPVVGTEPAREGTWPPPPNRPAA